MKIKLCVFLVPLILLSACTWVKLTPAGEKVRLLTVSQVADCKLIGRTTTSVLAKAGFVERNEAKVAGEVAMLARNSGADMGGDTIAPLSAVKDGEQTFGVYQCHKR